MNRPNRYANAGPKPEATPKPGVLAVLTQVIADSEVRDRRYAETLREARATVERLAEAADSAILALSAPGAPTRSEREEIIASLRAALAAFRGEA